MTAPLTPADTRIDPALTHAFGVAELHGLYFAHKSDRGGWCDAVAISVPETPRRLVKRGLAVARTQRARVAFTCDTHEQAQQMYRLARRLLPDHRHVAMERAEAGAWGQLA